MQKCNCTDFGCKESSSLLIDQINPHASQELNPRPMSTRTDWWVFVSDACRVRTMSHFRSRSPPDQTRGPDRLASSWTAICTSRVHRLPVLAKTVLDTRTHQSADATIAAAGICRHSHLVTHVHSTQLETTHPRRPSPCKSRRRRKLPPSPRGIPTR